MCGELRWLGEWHGGVEGMSDRESKVIGCFAYFPGGDVLCTESSACIIAGSLEAMRQYLSKIQGGKQDEPTIKKTRFGEILTGLRQGAAYAFDAESYNRFYPLAQFERLNVDSPEVFIDKKGEGNFLSIRLGLASPNTSSVFKI